MAAAKQNGRKAEVSVKEYTIEVDLGRVPEGEAPRPPVEGGDKGSGKGSGKQMHNRELAQRGENAAARYLQWMGYEIEAMNWRCKAGEADIVARDGDCVVFVEVKTRSNIDKGFPEEAVTPEKRSRYERIAALFLRRYPADDLAVRFDVIGILVLDEEKMLIKHHVNAFGAA